MWYCTDVRTMAGLSRLQIGSLLVLSVSFSYYPSLERTTPEVEYELETYGKSIDVGVY
jgi:hypothetical protein